MEGQYLIQALNIQYQNWYVVLDRITPFWHLFLQNVTLTPVYNLEKQN